MIHVLRFFIGMVLATTAINTFATPNNIELAVWANEAIVATYTYDHENFLNQQKAIAKYFTSAGWIAYSDALNNAHLPETVKTNAYFVNAVATWPPEITNLGATHWKAVMPILVVYKNPQYQQKQSLQITITFDEVPSKQGVRGLAISSINAVVTAPPCRCEKKPTAS